MVGHSDKGFGKYADWPQVPKAAVRACDRWQHHEDALPRQPRPKFTPVFPRASDSIPIAAPRLPQTTAAPFKWLYRKRPGREPSLLPNGLTPGRLRYSANTFRPLYAGYDGDDVDGPVYDPSPALLSTQVSRNDPLDGILVRLTRGSLL